MKDTLETNLPEEAGKLEETKKPVETPEIDATADVEANDTAEADAAIAAGKLTKEEILAKLTELVETSVETSRGEVEALKQAYYKIRRNEVEELKKVFIADGGEEKDFTAGRSKPISGGKGKHAGKKRDLFVGIIKASGNHI